MQVTVTLRCFIFHTGWLKTSLPWKVNALHYLGISNQMQCIIDINMANNSENRMLDIIIWFKNNSYTNTPQHVECSVWAAQQTRGCITTGLLFGVQILVHEQGVGEWHVVLSLHHSSIVQPLCTLEVDAQNLGQLRTSFHKDIIMLFIHFYMSYRKSKIPPSSTSQFCK